MKPTLLNINRPRPEKKKFVAVLIFLIATVASGCAGLRKFPTKNVYEVDLENQICGQYEITSVRPKIQFKHSKDMSLSSCNGVFGFSSNDMPQVLDWADDAANYAEKKCTK